MFCFSTFVFAGYFLMVQIRSDKMHERIAKFQESFNIKFNDHKEDMKAFIQNLLPEFKKEMKQFSQKEHRINIIKSEKPCFSNRLS